MAAAPLAGGSMATSYKSTATGGGAAETPIEIAQRSKSETQNMRCKLFITNVLLVGAFLALGTAFYSIAAGWQPLDALYFSVVTLTTVGYGDLSPETDFEKCFTVLYVLIGIAIIGFQLSSMVDIFVNVQEDVALGLLGGAPSDDDLVRFACCGREVIAVDTDDFFCCERKIETREGDALPRRTCVQCLRSFARCLDRTPVPTVWFKFIACLVILGILLAVGVVIVVLTDKDKGSTTMIDAIYFVVISATTVGYGDRTIKGTYERVAWSAWLMMVVVVLAKIFDEFTDARVKTHMLDLTKKLREMELSKASILSMDYDGDGRVSKVEFLRRKLDEAFDESVMSMFDQICEQFEKLDKGSHDGYLDDSDLEP